MDKHTNNARVADSNLAGAALMTASGTGSSLFVINLCASMAPVANVGKSLPGLETYRLYQVARREDGRTRYRLRLGFFTSEADAEAVLNTVRGSYPTAFTACLCDEDRKFARGFAPEPSAPPKIAVVVENKSPAKAATPPPAQQKAAAPVPAKPAAAPAPKAAPATPAAQPAAARDAKLAAPSPQTKVPAPAASKAPAGKEPVEIELSWEPPQLQTPPNAPTVSTTSKTPQVIKAAPAATKPASASAPAPKPAVPVAKTTAPPKAAPPKTAPPKATIEAPAKLRASIELSLESESAAAPAPKASAPSTEPFRVSNGVDLPDTSLSLESTAKMRAVTPPAAAAPAKPAAKPAAPVAAAKAPAPATSETSKMKAAQATVPAAIKDAARNPIANLPELDSTQTIRALTSDELQDESQEKWYAIQLAVSDQPVNLDAMPRLDIFEAYRLYSVASAGSGKITHSLRIGFFREEVSAQAVSGYLNTFFASPSVVRISIAEQARFKDPPAPKAKPAPKAEVLDLSHARERSPKPIPTVTMEVETPRFDPTATGSFKASSTGVHKAMTATGTHRALGATGAHKALKVASKSSPPPTKRSASVSKASATGKHKLQPKKSLEEQLLDEAREVELSASGIRKLPKNDSLLSKMFGKLTKS